MTHDRARKKAVRRRMAQTGEKYTEARRALHDTAGDTEAKPERSGDPARGNQFQRFTEQARRVVVRARDEARALDSELVGTDHILLGLLREKDDGIAARVLRSLDITLERVRPTVRRSSSGGAVTGRPQFTPGAKHVLELALREALSLRHNYVGTEHILLGLVREQGAAAGILLDCGADAEKVRSEVIRNLAGTGGSPSAIGGAAKSIESISALLERFSERGKEVIHLAWREAGELGHEHIGGEHLLLGLLRERDGLGGRALEALGVTLERARAGVMEQVPGGRPATYHRPLTPRAKRVCERALREALTRGVILIGTEHILLALVRESEGPAHDVLLDLDADSGKVRNEVLTRMSRGR